MATGPGFPYAQSVFIPNFSASGKLAVSFFRDPKQIPTLKWIQMVESPRNNGYYLKLTAQEAARVPDLNDFLWNWNSEAPNLVEGLESFNFLPFLTQRHVNGFALDEDTERQAEWDIESQHVRIHAQKAATIRSNIIIGEATKAANWQTTADPDMVSNHTGTASAYVGGFLDQATTTTLYIKKFLDKSRLQIDLDSLGVVQSDQLHVIMNPNTACLLAESAEIHDYIKSSPDAMHEIRTGSTPNAKYGPGLPSTIYGVDVVVDNTVLVSSRKNATLSKAYAFPDKTILLASRIGELDGTVGPSFSTITWFWYRDDMTVESKADPDNRRNKHRLVDCGIPVVTAPVTGFLLTSATSVASPGS